MKNNNKNEKEKENKKDEEKKNKKKKDEEEEDKNPFVQEDYEKGEYFGTDEGQEEDPGEWAEEF
ncbi:MAG: hypothetical protein GF329_15280 [Candidatus Lokiarchaeota archaeon]|nr:hypothetical protein [Candidatus Lokiarchaeota archaeon]